MVTLKVRISIIIALYHVHAIVKKMIVIQPKVIIHGRTGQNLMFNIYISISIVIFSINSTFNMM